MSETMDAWLCKACGEYSLIEAEKCQNPLCRQAKPDVTAIHQIGLKTPAALELLGNTGKAAKKAKKGAGKGKASGKRDGLDTLYKRVLWNEFDRIIHFAVDGEPIAKERPRLGRGRKAYTPKKTLNYEETVADAARKIMNGAEPLGGLLQLEIIIMRSNGRRADVDNVLKCLMDAMNGIIYYDDAQVAELNRVRIVRYAKTTGVSILVRQFKQAVQQEGKAA